MNNEVLPDDEQNYLMYGRADIIYGPDWEPPFNTSFMYVYGFEISVREFYGRSV